MEVLSLREGVAWTLDEEYEVQGRLFHLSRPRSVARKRHLTLNGVMNRGTKIRRLVSGWTAPVIEHPNDYLNGVLISEYDPASHVGPR